jgi:hypothetical protein
MDDHDRMLFYWSKFLPMIEENFAEWQAAKQQQEQAEPEPEPEPEQTADHDREEQRLVRPGGRRTRR